MKWEWCMWRKGGDGETTLRPLSWCWESDWGRVSMQRRMTRTRPNNRTMRTTSKPGEKAGLMNAIDKLGLNKAVKAGENGGCGGWRA